MSARGTKWRIEQKAGIKGNAKHRQRGRKSQGARKLRTCLWRKEGRGFGEGYEWEGMMMKARARIILSGSPSSMRPRRSRKTTIPDVDSIPWVTAHIETTPMQDVSQPDSTSTQIQSDDPSPPPVGLSAVPLTHLFKHSLSLPSSNPRLTLPESTITLPSDAASPGDWEASRIGTPGTPSLRRHPHSRNTTTGDTAASFPLLCTPFTSSTSPVGG